jgi:hypothetical protein
MVQPQYSPKESLQRVKLMMKYDTSKTLNENKKSIKEQSPIPIIKTQLPTWTNNYPCLLQNNLGTLKKTSSDNVVVIVFGNDGDKIFFWLNERCMIEYSNGTKLMGDWSCKDSNYVLKTPSSLYIQFVNGDVYDGDKFVKADDAQNTKVIEKLKTDDTTKTGGEYQPKEDGAYTTPGDPYQYKVVNGQWYTKSWKNREKIIKDWVSLENNPTATAELDRRHSGARVPNDTQLPPTTPEVSGEEINMPNSDF